MKKYYYIISVDYTTGSRATQEVAFSKKRATERAAYWNDFYNKEHLTKRAEILTDII